jgi:muconolactone delta-isomerase
LENEIMQFMASISLDTTRRSEVERLIPAESERVRELQHQGVLDALYVPDGSGAPASLWVVLNGDSRDAVQRVIENLPLYPYMQVDLVALRSLQANQ